MRRRRFAFEFQGCESRLLTSSLASQGPVEASVRRARPALPALVSGRTVITQDAPDAGRTIRLQGSVRAGSLGEVPFTGDVSGVGFTRRGRAMGSITFASPTGSLTIRLTGPTQPGFSPLPSTLRSEVIDAKGDFRGVKGTGAARFALTDDGAFTLGFQPPPRRGA